MNKDNDRNLIYSVVSIETDLPQMFEKCFIFFSGVFVHGQVLNFA